MKKKAVLLACAVFVLLVLVAGQVFGQVGGVHIAWWYLGGGGGSSSSQSGTVSFSSSLGQAITGDSSGDTGITSGFWSDPDIVEPVLDNIIYLPAVRR